MVSFRALAAVPAILLCVVLADALGQTSPENALKLEAKVILERVRDTYRTLSAYHFERVLRVQEAGADRKLTNIAQFDLVTATENATSAALFDQSSSSPRINLDRIRVGTKSHRGEMLQVCDGQTCASYTSEKNEYMMGSRFRDVNTSVGGSMMMVYHFFTFLALEEGAIQEPKVIGEEEVEVGKDRRKCYVIAGVMRPRPPHRDPAKPPPPDSRPGVDWLLSMLSLQGLLHEGGPRLMYTPWPVGEKPDGDGEPTRVTLWIDQNAHVVLRSKWASAQLYKGSLDGPQPLEKVAVDVTDSFTIASVGVPPPADLFRFTPPEGAKEVPNVASSRSKRK